ncbi:hypothetical protein Btru_006025, partial [Bulinus truncatus]
MFPPGDPRLRYLYIVWAVLENLGFGGLSYGWGSLVYVLKDEGIYLDLCANDTDTLIYYGNQTSLGCYARASRLELVYTFASVSIGLGSCILGQINFKCGTRPSRVTASLMFITGSFLIAFVTVDTPWLVFPGLSFAAFGGVGFLITNYQIGNLFPVGKGAVIGVLNGAFDSSDGVQLMVKFGYENGISRKTSYLILACSNLLTFLSTILFLPKDYVQPVQPARGGAAVGSDTKPLKETEEIVSGNFRLLPKQLLSPKYILHLCWFCVLALRFNCMLGSMNRTLERQLNSQDEVSRYTNTLLYTMMAGIVAAPLSGAFFELNVYWFRSCRSPFARAVKPTVIPLALGSTFCVVMSSLVMFENPSHLYVIFVLLLLLRASLFTYGCAYIDHAFSSQYFVSLIGITTFVCCLVSLLQHVMFEWSEQISTMQ